MPMTLKYALKYGHSESRAHYALELLDDESRFSRLLEERVLYALDYNSINSLIGDIQDYIGQDDGGYAGMFFEFDADGEFEIAKKPYKERLAAFRKYIKHECLYYTPAK